jgi:hypothetical protein
LGVLSQLGKMFSLRAIFSKITQLAQTIWATVTTENVIYFYFDKSLDTFWAIFLQKFGEFLRDFFFAKSSGHPARQSCRQVTFARREVPKFRD